MLTASVIARKRDGFELSGDEIRHMVREFVDGEVTDYQMSAFAMAVAIRGMTDAETSALTAAMTDSGERLQRLDDVPRVDKHSTGGLGDKVSLVLAPLLATMNVSVPMISGRGLGISGGTLDKLDSIPGFRTELDESQFNRVLGGCGCVIAAATSRIAPADRRLYALRDVTATVPSQPLIVSSILSKKLAANLDALVMDVKCGSGAFMRSEADARSLAQALVGVGSRSGLPTVAVLSDMDQPLGRSVGNAVEVNEAMSILKRDFNDPLIQRVEDLTVHLCARLLALQALSPQDLPSPTSMSEVNTQRAVIQAVIHDNSAEHYRRLLRSNLDSGLAWERFERMVQLQGGSLTDLQNGLPVASPFELFAKDQGYIESIDSQALGEILVLLGGGRRKMGDRINPRVGLELSVQVGDPVDKGQPLMTVMCDADLFDRYRDRLQDAVRTVHQSISHRPVLLTLL